MKTNNLTEVRFLAPESSISLLKEHGYTMIKEDEPNVFLAMVTNPVQFKQQANKLCGLMVIFRLEADGSTVQYA